MTLPVSEYGRFVVWMTRWSAYNGAAQGCSLYATEDEAVRAFIWNANMFVTAAEWERFPFGGGEYPADDRDGLGHLTPRYRIQWQGGWCSAECTEVETDFTSGDIAAVEAIFDGIKARRFVRRLTGETAA